MVYGFFSLFVCLIRTNSFITDHCVCSPGVSFTLFTVLLDASLTMVKLCVYFYLKHQSSSPQTCFRLDRSNSSRMRPMHQLLMIYEELD